VVGGFSDWCAVSSGDAHSSALRSNGTVWSWGRNTSGQLADNTSANRSSPVSAVGGFTDWSQTDAGNYQTIALRLF
jgi:alpha-tubulin suppressor-like RCC1 family protein